MRNNPLKYLDPTGEKADVEIQIDEKNKTGTIKITASIALWTSTSSGLSSKDLQKAAADYKKDIESGWSGTYTKDGITFTVSADVSVQVSNGGDAATKSGAQNVIEVTNGPARSDADSVTSRASIFGGPDTGKWNNKSPFIAHEFGHLLGVGDRSSGSELMNTNNMSSLQVANGNDYSWAFSKEVGNQRAESRPNIITGRELETRSSPGFSRGEPTDSKTTRTLGAPAGFRWWR